MVSLVRHVPVWAALSALAACASDSASTGPDSSRATRASRPEVAVTAPGTAMPPGMGLPPLVNRHGELALQLASQLRGAKSCGDVASVLDRYVEKHRGELGPTTAAVIAWERGADPDELKTYYRNVFPAIEVRIDAGERCEKHAGARLAFDRFFAATGLD